MKITLENQQILRRLQAKKANYSVEKWNNDFNQQSIYRQQISENPYEFGTKDTIDPMASTQSYGLRLSTATETLHTGRNHIIKTSENPNRKSHQIYE